MDIGGFLQILWAPGIMVTGVATRSAKRPHRTVLESWVVSQCQKVKDNDMPYGSDYIGYVIRDIWPNQYRERSNLPGVDEEKNSMPRL